MLKLFGFSNEFIKIISNYLIGGKATINLENGNFTQFFDIEQGIGQGLPLSVLIFILSIEPLIIKIVHTNNLKKLEWEGWGEADRTEAFADDMSVFTHFDLEDIRNLTTILDTFGRISNLKLNKAKTSIAAINREASAAISNDIEAIGYKLEKNSIIILGHHITTTRLDNCTTEVNLNWKKVINSIHLVSFKIKMLKLPLLQTVKALKNFLLAKLSYISATTTCPKLYANTIENVVINTINAAGYKFSREYIFNQNNGLGFPDISIFCNALLTSTFVKVRKNKEFWTKKVEHCFFNRNPELIQKQKAKGITEMIIKDIKLFYSKKNSRLQFKLTNFF